MITRQCCSTCRTTQLVFRQIAAVRREKCWNVPNPTFKIFRLTSINEQSFNTIQFNTMPQYIKEYNYPNQSARMPLFKHRSILDVSELEKLLLIYKCTFNWLVQFIFWNTYNRRETMYGCHSAVTSSSNILLLVPQMEVLKIVFLKNELLANEQEICNQIGNSCCYSFNFICFC
jgi:hypothetical protein